MSTAVTAAGGAGENIGLVRIQAFFAFNGFNQGTVRDEEYSNATSPAGFAARDLGTDWTVWAATPPTGVTATYAGAVPAGAVALWLAPPTGCTGTISYGAATASVIQAQCPVGALMGLVPGQDVYVKASEAVSGVQAIFI